MGLGIVRRSVNGLFSEDFGALPLARFHRANSLSRQVTSGCGSLGARAPAERGTSGLQQQESDNAEMD
jgi:hypothetical protein